MPLLKFPLTLLATPEVLVDVYAAVRRRVYHEQGKRPERLYELSLLPSLLGLARNLLRMGYAADYGPSYGDKFARTSLGLARSFCYVTLSSPQVSKGTRTATLLLLLSMLVTSTVTISGASCASSIVNVLRYTSVYIRSSCYDSVADDAYHIALGLLLREPALGSDARALSIGATSVVALNRW